MASQTPGGNSSPDFAEPYSGQTSLSSRSKRCRERKTGMQIHRMTLRLIGFSRAKGTKKPLPHTRERLEVRMSMKIRPDRSTATLGMLASRLLRQLANAEPEVM